MDVGIREFKEHLSDYVERAARGELIRVTDRGRPKAVLGPVPGRSLLEEGVAEGWIRAGKDSPPRPVQRHHGTMMTTAATLKGDRDE